MYHLEVFEGCIQRLIEYFDSMELWSLPRLTAILWNGDFEMNVTDPHAVLIAHDRWANGELYEACRGLSEE